LVFLDLDRHSCDLIVQHVVAGILSGITPVSSIGHSFLENLEVPAWASEHVAEPRWEWFEWGVDAIIRGGIQVDDIGSLIGTLGAVVPRHCTIVIEPNPFGLLIQSSADRDVEVSNLPIVELVAFRWLVESLLVMEYLLLQVVQVVFVAFGSHAGARLSVGDGLEESVGDAT
jgi:hypothetical protein